MMQENGRIKQCLDVQFRSPLHNTHKPRNKKKYYFLSKSVLSRSIITCLIAKLHSIMSVINILKTPPTPQQRVEANTSYSINTSLKILADCFILLAFFSVNILRIQQPRFMEAPQSASSPPHQYPQAIQLKLYQAFIFSIPILFSIILFLLFYLFYLKRRASGFSSTSLVLPRTINDVNVTIVRIHVIFRPQKCTSFWWITGGSFC